MVFVENVQNVKCISKAIIVRAVLLVMTDVELDFSVVRHRRCHYYVFHVNAFHKHRFSSVGC